MNSYDGSGERGLYKFAVYEGGIGPMELMDPDIATVDEHISTSSCWVHGDTVYYAHRDASLCCNGNVVDPTGATDMIIGFCNDELLYAANVQSDDGKYSNLFPFTLRAATPQSYRDINGCVIDYKRNIDNIWFVGDYDYWGKGTLYLFEDGEAVPLVNDVNVIG